jgi:hypothetical protein
MLFSGLSPEIHFWNNNPNDHLRPEKSDRLGSIVAEDSVGQAGNNG